MTDLSNGWIEWRSLLELHEQGAQNTNEMTRLTSSDTNGSIDDRE